MLHDISVLLWIIIKILAIVIPLLLCVAYLTYAERKVIGYIQERIGPNRVGFKGLLQPIADLIKLIIKEVKISNNGVIHNTFLTGSLASYNS